MSEKNNLYFIPILAKAFESVDQIEAMNKALREIIKLGKRKEYHVGYEQFKQFVESGIKSQNKAKELIDRIKSNPELLEKYYKIDEEQKTDISLEIYKEEKQISSQSLVPKEEQLTFTNIEPGNYSIRLSNGRVMWDGEIKIEDVTINKSQPQKVYSLAAKTDKSDITPTRTIELLKDEMQLLIYAGLEFGKFKIILK